MIPESYSQIENILGISRQTRPFFKWISSTDTYKPHLALISVKMLEMREREREREGECERDKMRDNWSIRL